VSTRSYSAVICTYNRRSYVEECVRSVLEQTRPPEQIIVVDDGSSDGTSQYLRDRFPNILVVEQQNRGRSVALNRALSLASCDWICFLDDDDLWHRDKLAEVDEYLASTPGCRAVNHPMWFFRTHGGGESAGYGFSIDFFASSLAECHAAVDRHDPSRNDTTYLEIDGTSYRRLLERNRGAYSASVVHRDVVLAAGGMPPMLTCADDWLMFLNVSRLAEWHTLPKRLAFARVHDGRSTGSVENSAAILAAFVVVWYGGRAFPERTSGDETRSEMAVYQAEYRRLVQTLFWDALRNRRWRGARDVRRLGRPLVRGWGNWLYVHAPPPITYRIERRFRPNGRR
jgi:glycosyltransferase involved in cell wall biosynthesis